VQIDGVDAAHQGHRGAHCVRQCWGRQLGQTATTCRSL
jgi:uncharacterized Zn-binding protein involved in type VI secretion